MDWRKKYRQASFRGVPFFVATAEGDFGRRGQHHEYAKRDKGYWEDLGEKDPSFTIDGYVTEKLTGGYMEARDALLTACRQPGAAELIHPYLGAKTVTCTGCRLRESADEGGVARFSLTFIEAGEKVEPKADIDTAAAVDMAADDAMLATQEDFADEFSLVQMPGYVVDGALGVVNDGLTLLDAAAGPMVGDAMEMMDLANGALDAFEDVQAFISNFDPAAFFASQLRSLQGGAFAAIFDAMGLAAKIGGLVRLMSMRSGSPEAAYAAQQGMWSYGEDLAPVPTITPARRQQAANQAALSALFRRSALIEGARMSSRMAFESYDQAAAVRDELAERLDAEMEVTGNDTLFTRLLDLRAAVVRDVTDRGGDLSRVGRWTPPTTMPALVAAYEVYGDPLKDSELVSRNHIAHPGFVPAAEPLEVLTNG